MAISPEATQRAFPPAAAQTASAIDPASIGKPATLRKATAEDVPQLAQALAGAFNHDPAFEWLLPNERKRPAGLRRYFAIELRAVGLARGSVWTTDELAGAALSSDPGKWRLPLHSLASHSRAFHRAFGVRLPRAVTLLTRMESKHVRQPHHYFPAIGVAPEHQGQGLGRGLMAPTLTRCDQEGLHAYLEASSERNAALYERLGFHVIRELHYGARQPLRLMLRPPFASVRSPS
ncbi:MAG TPA: GNAT family N-acetyltransferase [Solirubrobacteraceae bacterium]|jgi:ribosomal protein S18 acetylase RimI-like enzyme|nr:GNAT family N-acetyltransferase [Solirubrobacteraceae bacterium]